MLSHPHFFAVKIVIIRLISHACFLSCNSTLSSPYRFGRGTDWKSSVSAKFISAWNGGGSGGAGNGGGDGVGAAVGDGVGATVGATGGVATEATVGTAATVETAVIVGIGDSSDGVAVVMVVVMSINIMSNLVTCC